MFKEEQINYIAKNLKQKKITKNWLSKLKSIKTNIKNIKLKWIPSNIKDKVLLINCLINNT